ncbi:MAG: hypothetical protein AABX51_07720, partial [Nanoarchaeota archaeon]
VGATPLRKGNFTSTIQDPPSTVFNTPSPTGVGATPLRKGNFTSTIQDPRSIIHHSQWVKVSEIKVGDEIAVVSASRFTPARRLASLPASTIGGRSGRQGGLHASPLLDGLYPYFFNVNKMFSVSGNEDRVAFVGSGSDKRIHDISVVNPSETSSNFDNVRGYIEGGKNFDKRNNLFLLLGSKFGAGKEFIFGNYRNACFNPTIFNFFKKRGSDFISPKMVYNNISVNEISHKSNPFTSIISPFLTDSIFVDDPTDKTFTQYSRSSSYVTDTIGNNFSSGIRIWCYQPFYIFYLFFKSFQSSHNSVVHFWTSNIALFYHLNEFYHKFIQMSSRKGFSPAFSTIHHPPSIVHYPVSPVIWDKIVSIEYVGYEHVYDIEVEGTHNFIGNNIFAHNTYIGRGQGTGVGDQGAEVKNVDLEGDRSGKPPLSQEGLRAAKKATVMAAVVMSSVLAVLGVTISWLVLVPISVIISLAWFSVRKFSRVEKLLEPVVEVGGLSEKEYKFTLNKDLLKLIKRPFAMIDDGSSAKGKELLKKTIYGKFCFRMADWAFNNVGDENYLCKSLISKSQAYASLGMRKEAVKTLNDALTIVNKKITNEAHLYEVLPSLAQVYASLGDIEGVGEVFKIANEKITDKYWLSKVLPSLAQVYASLGMEEKAMEILNDVLIIANEKITNESYLSEVLFSLAQAYTSLGDIEGVGEVFKIA